MVPLVDSWLIIGNSSEVAASRNYQHRRTIYRSNGQQRAVSNARVRVAKRSEKVKQYRQKFTKVTGKQR